MRLTIAMTRARSPTGLRPRITRSLAASPIRTAPDLRRPCGAPASDSTFRAAPGCAAAPPHTATCEFMHIERGPLIGCFRILPDAVAFARVRFTRAREVRCH
ncbi:hypothetical protein GCM10009559_18090 [Pseudonocardia zijingensis]|uniref:Uncharacterized protein n=1 Tax=Pseudonocardia zijingensis TaxID=153376 RepID=A0ABN1PP55_9PSEU